ncbi:MAG: triose-phosphate isomerase [Eubacteriales bacterium]|nr:triose-phosphate isomerase [Eubacteriales bacterium]
MAQVKKQTVDQLQNISGKKILVRVDFNVPRDKASGAITDDRRIRAALPTIKKLLAEDARVILVTHLGRPKGFDPELSTKILAERLSELIERPVQHAEDVIGESAKAKAAALKNGEILLLENVRYHKEETKNDPEFARELASLAELYVNDAFGTAHRAHASTEGVAHFLYPVAGYLMQKEIEIMAESLEAPEHPFVAILGGAKVSDKIGVIKNLMKKADKIIIGGGMTYTFLAAKGLSVGKSLCESDKLEEAKALMAEAEQRGVELIFPVDLLGATEFDREAKAESFKADAIPAEMMGLDLGPETVKLFAEAIKDAKTVVWNGPLGVFEFPQFAEGTNAVAKAIAESNARSIVGGGDLAAAIENSGYAEQFTHISTGGGASLELLEGKNLPGLAALLPAHGRRNIPAGNWKMNKQLPAEAKSFFAEFIEALDESPERIIFNVPYTVLSTALEATAYSRIFIGAENGHAADNGAYTGEISLRALAEMGVPYVVLGHSERRQYFGESSELVNEKVLAALNWGRFPIMCCGETLAEREADATLEVIKEQVLTGLEAVKADDFWRIAIAYEPIWAIGTGRTASSEQAEEVCRYIRELIAEEFSQVAAEQLVILYGGSVKPDNAAELFAMPNIDGGLVGGASLKAEDFAKISGASAAAEQKQ